MKAGKRVVTRWSCGTTKRIHKGDRAFLIRLGEEPKGIFASGTIVRGSYEDTHWDEQKATAGEICHFIQVQFDTLLNPDTDSILPRKLLNTGVLSEMHWDTQMSGVRIPDKVAAELEKAWKQFANAGSFSLPEEVEDTETIIEGALHRVSVNAYERSPEARRKCIAHYGMSCSACGFNFGKEYGEVGEELIHVHHLRQLAEIGKEYQIDPIKDLRPVCPNCHAIIHRRKSPYSIEEVQSLLRKAKRRR